MCRRGQGKGRERVTSVHKYVNRHRGNDVTCRSTPADLTYRSPRARVAIAFRRQSRDVRGAPRADKGTDTKRRITKDKCHNAPLFSLSLSLRLRLDLECSPIRQGKFHRCPVTRFGSQLPVRSQFPTGFLRRHACYGAGGKSPHPPLRRQDTVSIRLKWPK